MDIGDYDMVVRASPKLRGSGQGGTIGKNGLSPRWTFERRKKKEGPGSCKN